MAPIEKNARTLVGALVQHFPAGATSEDLRRQFEKDASLARQSYYNALGYAKQQGWIVGGGRDRFYTLNPDLSWKEPPASIGENLEKDRLEHLVNSQTRQIAGLEGEIERLRDWSSGSDADRDGVAIPSLVRIVADSASTVRQRLKAASTILAYRVQDSSVVEFTKRFLQSVCTSTDIATDHRIEASELLRRSEAPRVASESVRPSYRDIDTAEGPVEPLAVVLARRRAHCDALTAKIEREMGLRPDEIADVSDPQSDTNGH